MRIKSEIKLNFDDVLLQPKRSTLTSRADVKMTRKFYKLRQTIRVLSYICK